MALKVVVLKGNLVSKYPIKKKLKLKKGISTLLPRKVWYDDTVQRLNVDAEENC
jgi:topoisomerase-4 subunit A